MKIRWIAVLMVLVLALPVFAGDKVPYKATLASTSFDIVFPVVGADIGRCAFLPITAEDGTPLMPPGMAWGLITIHAVGNSTVMGLVTDVQSHCAPLPMDPENAPAPPVGAQMPFVAGDAVLTAANGDSIHGTYSGMMTVTDVGMVIDGLLITDGGTGRFVGASGEGRAFGVQGTGTSALTITGTMTSPGAAKKN